MCERGKRGKREGRRRENSYDRSGSEARTGGDVINGFVGWCPFLSLSTALILRLLSPKDDPLHLKPGSGSGWVLQVKCYD